jgi:hypothetical protein
MKSKTIRVITVETLKQTTVRNRSDEVFMHCDICEKETRILTPENFARLRGMTARDVYRQIETGDHHYLETENRELLICSGSLNQTTLPPQNSGSI